MRDVKLVRLSEDGTHLVLAHEGTGEEFALRIDDRIRGAVVSDRARIGQLPIERPSRLRPKEIQARLRAGESSEEIAAAADVPLERILRYAGPVLAEREYIAEQARRCVLRRQAGEAAGRTLDQVVAARLEIYGVDPELSEWDAWRAPDGRWAVAVKFRLDGEEQRATFSYDPLGRLVVPSDDAARAVVEGPRTDPSVAGPGSGAVHGPGPRTPRDGHRLRLAPLPSPQAAPEVFAGDPDTGTREVADVRPLRPSAPPRPAARADQAADPMDTEDTVDLSSLGRQPGGLKPVQAPLRRPATELRREPEPAPGVLSEPDPVVAESRNGLRTMPAGPERAEPVPTAPFAAPAAERSGEPVSPPDTGRPPAAVREVREVREVPAPLADEAPAPAPQQAPQSPRPAEPSQSADSPSAPASQTAPASQSAEPFRSPQPVEVPAEPEPPAARETAVPADATPGTPAEPVPDPAPDPGPAEAQPAATADADEDTEPEPAPRPVRRPKPANAAAQRKRASRSTRKGNVPSWDDILFGGGGKK